VLFFKSTGSSGSSISPSRTFARSLAASYPFLLHPKTKKPSTRPAAAAAHRKLSFLQQGGAIAEERQLRRKEEVEEEKKSLPRRKHRETETERNTH